MTLLQMCRPIYRVGRIMFLGGILLTSIGVVIGLFGKGWTTSLIGMCCVLLGMIAYGVPLMYLGNEIKLIDESLTAKQVSGLASRHLNEHGDDASNVYEFLEGIFGFEADQAKIHRRLAERGNAEAQYELGRYYETVVRDEVEAMKWYLKAAEQEKTMPQPKLGRCCYVLGEFYLMGKGVTKNLGQAVSWLRKAAEQGDADALILLSGMYDEGLNVTQDYMEAIKWFRKAAEQGSAYAQFKLGQMYHDGKGVGRDDMEAVKWFRKGAEQENAAAQYSLGVCYTDGLGVAKDVPEAVKWLRKAAEQDYAAAQYNLGLCYRDGLGVPKDDVEGKKWCRKALEQGFIPITDNREK